MLTAAQYAEIDLLSRSGLSNRDIRRVTGRARETIWKVLHLKMPPPIVPRIRKKGLDPFRSKVEQGLKAGITCDNLLVNLRQAGYRGSLRALQRFVRAFWDENGSKKTTATISCGASLFAEEHFWMLRLMQGNIDAVALKSVCLDQLSIEDAQLLIEKTLTGRLTLRNRAVVVAAHLRGIPMRSIALFLQINRQTVREYCRSFHGERLKGLFDFGRKKIKKADDQRYRDAVFKILHAPPSTFGFNRTTWKMSDIRSVLKAQGHIISAVNIRLIIRNAGFRFRKARKVLTSNDPNYRQKLQGITAILHRLKPDEKFFSIDEFGPFAVKIRGGRSLVKAGEFRSVPQNQRSKGRLICTAALELSENQVTHFFSEKKNTGEMLKLLDILLVAYAGQSCIYFSWDSASWHASKKLYGRVAEINSDAYRATHSGPRVELAPLPTCAQFLNVIESVFSGMARAVIHNSDYPSTAVCMGAIDRYFAERNTYFKTHPKRAGNKLWGDERVSATFDEANNCKAPRL